MSDTRARITITDIVFALMTIAFVGALWPVFFDAYQGTAADLTTGTEMLYLLILPVIVLVLIFKLYQKAVRGYGA